MNKVLKTPDGKVPIQMLYMELGPSETARRMNLKIGSVTKWASRYGWTRDRAVAAAPAPRTGRPALNLSQMSQPDPVTGVAAVVGAPAALKQAHEDLATRTRTALARRITATAEQAADQPLPVQSTAQLRELAAAAGRVFDWGSNKSPSTVHNTLVITADQLKQIGMLQGA